MLIAASLPNESTAPAPRRDPCKGALAPVASPHAIGLPELGACSAAGTARTTAARSPDCLYNVGAVEPQEYDMDISLSLLVVSIRS